MSIILGRLDVLCHVSSHELANDLSRGAILGTTDFKEVVPQIALYSDAKSYVFFCHPAV